MNGQMESYKDKQNIVDEYLSKTDIYASLKPLDFDLRGLCFLYRGKRYFKERKPLYLRASVLFCPD